MINRVSGRVKMLLAANLVAAIVLFGTWDMASAQWETYCPPDAKGCDCLLDNPWNPDGCYEVAPEGFLCSSNEYCMEPD